MSFFILIFKVFHEELSTQGLPPTPTPSSPHHWLLIGHLDYMACWLSIHCPICLFPRFSHISEWNLHCYKESRMKCEVKVSLKFKLPKCEQNPPARQLPAAARATEGRGVQRGELKDTAGVLTTRNVCLLMAPPDCQ